MVYLRDQKPLIIWTNLVEIDQVVSSGTFFEDFRLERNSRNNPLETSSPSTLEYLFTFLRTCMANMGDIAVQIRLVDSAYYSIGGLDQPIFFGASHPKL